MNRTRKTKLYVILIALVCLLTFCLCACAGSGVDGANGVNGKDGVNGKSAYEIWLDEGHTGSQADFLDWLKGADGADGQNGTDGADGQNGTDGQDGSNGTDGQDGSDGSDGQNGIDGKSAYEIFMGKYPYYQGTETQWINALLNGELRVHTITFKSEVADDITKYVLNGYTLSDIPEVPEKEGQTGAVWSVTDFSNITQDAEITAVYDMRKYVTFHNEFTDDENIVKTVEYGEALTDIPQITAKVGNNSKWSITDFSLITADMRVEAIYETQGLQYSLINQQTEYKVSKGEMSNQTKELFIADKQNGKPVSVIDDNAFSSCELTFAYIPDSIIEIRSGAFANCQSLTSIEIPSSVTSIGDGAFAYCGLTSIEIPNSVTNIKDRTFAGCKFTSIKIPNSVTNIGHSAFSGCSNLTGIDIPNSVTHIESSTFSDCSSLTSIEIPNSVLTFGDYSFLCCSSLKSIVIPSSVKSIGYRAFSGCSKLETIYYKGTQLKFNNLSVSSDGNNPFTDAMVYFYSQDTPTDDGYYWHYDADGKTPVIWTKQN